MIGTYEIDHAVSGRAYIGSTRDVDTRLRFHRHTLRRGSHFNAALQAAWNADGESAFTFRALTACEIQELATCEAAEIAARGWDRVFNSATAIHTGRPELSDDEAREVYRAAQGGAPLSVLATTCRAHPSVIRNIVSGRSYRTVTRGIPARGRIVARGDRNAAVKLTAEMVLDIRRRLEDGESAASLARKFGVTDVNVGLIRARKTWRHI